MVLKHYIILYRPNSFDETFDKRVPERDSSKIKIPKDCYAFVFYDIEEKRTGDKVLRSEPINYSGRYVVGKKVMTLEAIKEEMPDNKELIQLAKNSETKVVVLTKFNEWKILFKGDVVLCGLEGKLN